MTARRPLREDERRAWLRLSRTETIGATTFAALMARFSDVREALAAAPRLARRGGAESLRMPSDADAEDEIERLAGLGGRLIASIEPDFPSGLAALDPPPPMIECGHFKRQMIAVVGARNASALGIKFAVKLAADLGASGLVVVSGLARGIDHAAHKGALDTGTIAVIAGGVDIVYPPEHQQLYEPIHERGALFFRDAARHGAPGSAFPAPQPADIRPCPGRGGHRGSGALGLPDHGKLRARTGTRSLPRCPARRWIRAPMAQTGLSTMAQL